MGFITRAQLVAIAQGEVDPRTMQPIPESERAAARALVDEVFRAANERFREMHGRNPMEKSVNALPTFVIPGQVPGRSSVAGLDALTAMPKPLDMTGTEPFKVPVLTLDGITRGLPLEPTVAKAFQHFVGEQLQKAANELEFRSKLFQHVHRDMRVSDPTLRRALAQRAMDFYKSKGTSQANDRRVQLRVRGMRPEREMQKSEGEGTRGGHIIGHTASGKPIYGPSHEYKQATRSLDTARDGKDRKHIEAMKDAKDEHEMRHAASHGFTSVNEHLDAAEKHDEHASMKHGSIEGRMHAQLATAHRNAAYSVRKALASGSDGLHGWLATRALPSLMKSEGEGSRGGKVVGHFPSGKPIYASQGKPQHEANPHLSRDEHREIAANAMSMHAKHTAAGDDGKADLAKKLADAHEAAAKMKGRDPSTALVSAHAKMKANRQMGRGDLATSAKVDKMLHNATEADSPEEHKSAAEWHRAEAGRSLDRKSGKHPDSWHSARRQDRAELHRLMADAHERKAGG